jgi:putative DNA primase/helicase
MAARVTRGAEWPCGEGRAPLGNVILLTAEDDTSDTVVPRLAAASADLDRIHIIKMVETDERGRMFSLIDDLPLLRQKIIEVGDVRLVQIDPITAYMGHGKIDSYRTPDVRSVLAPIVDLAAELEIAIVGIMHFNKKMDVTNALLLISDSLAFGATARHVYAVVDDAENNRKLLIKGKNNLARKKQLALAYSFGTKEVGRDAKTGESIWAPHVLWHPQPVHVTATEAMQAATESKSPGARDNAKKFLADILANGPVAQSDIEEAANADCISKATLRRAKGDLKITAKKDGPKKDGESTWRWYLPIVTPDDPNW